MENKRPIQKEKDPNILEGKAHRIEYVVFPRGRAPTPPYGRSYMGEHGICYKIHNIFGNYSSYNDIKRDFKMQPIELFLKNFLRRAYNYLNDRSERGRHY